MESLTFWEIAFKSEGDYKNYDELVQAALADDFYQKIYPSVASEILLDNLLDFVQDINNRPKESGVDHGTLYKKPNGRQIDSSRRYYLVREPDSTEFNLYVRITKGRNLGKNKDEVELLIQYGLNYLKCQAKLPIVVDYLNFAQDSEYFIARERCEFISRLLHSNITTTRNVVKFDYDVKKLGRRKGQKEILSSDKTASSSPLINKKNSRSQSPSSERSQSSSSERSQSPLLNNKKQNVLLQKQQNQQLSEPTAKTVTSKSESPKNLSRKATIIATTKTSIREKQKSCKSRSATTNRLTPILDRLRTKSNNRIPVVSSASSVASSHIVLTNTKSKKKQTVTIKKRSRSLENETDNEHVQVLSVATTSTDEKPAKGATVGRKNKRLKK
ncbi:unnamed protein product [Rotaria socialis]|uniref:Uncharacterized protein n=1 Tax=Rotaria socialis TaxID=392032 RepID=A0A821B4R6_9BILA|nr:unnamed protein product [Rotaria socialis]CAF4589780.1 unnamed protein product [Rotaria socialis]